MLEQQIKKEVIIISGKKITQSGYYEYFGHVDKGLENCVVTEKAKSGLYLAEGSFAPDLGSCPHDIKWRLVS